MKAIVVHAGEPAPRLCWEPVADPGPDKGEVLVEVKATAVNRADLLQARGLYPPPPGVTDVMGLEMSGIVRALGPGAYGWAPGDRVMGLLAGGGYAEAVAVHEGLLMRLPDGWSFRQGAAVPEAWLTAFLNLFLEGELSEGQGVLVHAGASGVGTAAIQLAREARASVFATAGSAAKLGACRALGANIAVDYKAGGDFVAEIKAATGGRGVDLVLDLVGASYFKGNLAVLAAGGRLVTIGLMGGTRVELDLGVLLGKSLRLIGSRLRPRPLVEKVDLVRRFSDRFLPLLAAGRLRPIVDRAFPVAEAEAAHAYVQENRNIGKVILEVS
jgi:putative PIG3 family NAD(P)H quinone oxidoreductase